MKIPTRDLSFRDSYRLISGSMVPRPIAWVTTRNRETGLVNLAPFSFFTGCSVVPPMVCFAAERRLGQRKDTVRNVEDTGEFVVNIAAAKLVNEVALSARDLPPDVSEVEAAGLTLLPCDNVQVPRLADAPVAMECRLHVINVLGTSPHSLVIGHVVQFHVRDDVYAGGRIDFDALDALGRMAGDWYVTTRDRINVKRVDWRKDDY